MAVSGKTSDFEVPYLEETDIPDMGAGDKAQAERLNAILKGIKGDATLATTLALTIANGAVTSQKAKPMFGIKRQSAGNTLASAMSALAGCKLELAKGEVPVALKAIVVGVFTFYAQNAAADTATGGLFVDGAEQSGTATLTPTSPPTVGAGGTAVQIWTPTLAAESAHTLELRGKSTSGSNMASSTGATSLFYLLFAA